MRVAKRCLVRSTSTSKDRSHEENSKVSACSVLQSDRENRLLSFFCPQGLKHGILSRDGGFVHRVSIQPDEGTDNRGHKQPAILADPFLPGHSLPSL